ncbi:MAG TPA: AmmeMemoRadiSam system protein B [Candidatus Hydrogenedentes bacterium]|nr:AmmeMemoRadiSam system protein B [Candidatus Hydrogenedentota bacterium]
MTRYTKSIAGALLVVGISILFIGAGGNELRIRRVIAAGSFYPADPAQLRACVTQYLNEVATLSIPSQVTGVVLPHSPYTVTGNIMAKAVKQIPQGVYKRVIVLAPAMTGEFRGCSVPSIQFYRTPLGDVELDAPAVRRICVNSLIQIRGLVYREDAYQNSQAQRTTLHESETAIEVILPFLQVHLGEFKLVPILVSKLEKVTGKFDEHALDTIVNTLRAITDDETLVVVCSDFTRFGSPHNFTPFTRNILENISALDMQAFNLIQERRVKGFLAYMDESGNTITAPEALSVFMRLMPETSHGVLTGYDLSGRITGNPRTSVSYASMVFFGGSHNRARVKRPVIRITDKPAPVEEVESEVILPTTPDTESAQPDAEPPTIE